MAFRQQKDKNSPWLVVDSLVRWRRLAPWNWVDDKRIGYESKGSEGDKRELHFVFFGMSLPLLLLVFPEYGGL